MCTHGSTGAKTRCRVSTRVRGKVPPHVFLMALLTTWTALDHHTWTHLDVYVGTNALAAALRQTWSKVDACAIGNVETRAITHATSARSSRRVVRQGHSNRSVAPRRPQPHHLARRAAPRGSEPRVTSSGGGVGCSAARTPASVGLTPERQPREGPKPGQAGYAPKGARKYLARPVSAHNR